VAKFLAKKILAKKKILTILAQHILLLFIIDKIAIFYAVNFWSKSTKIVLITLARESFEEAARVTRLDEFSPIGYLFFFNDSSIPNYWVTFSTVKFMY
jgi:hypothetical protein